MDPAAPPPPFRRTPYLVGLVATAERFASLLEASSPTVDQREAMESEAAIATLRLDGSPITAPPDASADAPGVAASADAPTVPDGPWQDVFGFGDDVDDAVLGLEYQGARAALGADDLAEALLADPEESLADLHRRLTRGLADAQHQGTVRTVPQAVHDASTGRIIVRASPPEHVPSRLAALSVWLTTAGAREHALVCSGVVHYELLAIHPYESANGRIARTAARLVLRARGLDPYRLALTEPVLTRDPLGYYEEVARTIRRRDLTIWLEHWGEAVTGGLRCAARRLGLVEVEVPRRGAAFLATRDDPSFTVADYRVEVEVGPEEARADLEALLDAGRIARVLGARGLRFTMNKEDDDGVR